MRGVLATLIVLVSFSGAPHAAEPETADDREREEARLQEKFRESMAAIVDDFNDGSFDRLLRAIDKGDMLERIVGLRLIDPRLKRDFREQMSEDPQFDRFVESRFRNESKDGMRARLLLVESRGDRGRAVVRFDLPYFQVNYHEYELRIGSWDRVTVVDWTDYLAGYSFSDGVGMYLIERQPNKNAVRKLIDFPSVRESQIFQAIEVLKAARDGNVDRYFEIYDRLDPELQRQRFLLVAGLETTRKARKRRSQRKVLVAIAEHHPEDPLLALSLLDYYFPARQYDNAMAALRRVRDELGVEGGVMSARFSSTYLVMGALEEAVAYAEKSTTAEPDLELGWWALLRAQVAARDYDAAVTALGELQGKFGHALDPEVLSKDPSLKVFAGSQEYKDWFAAAADAGDGDR